MTRLSLEIFAITSWNGTWITLAGYGGLGPSISHPLTGETLAGQVLIQGPKVLELYRSWFKLPAIESLPSKARLRKTKISLLNKVEFLIPSQDPRYQDLLAPANGMDFIEIPEGFTYDSYMDGYFRDMVAHQLGHNLGLRHNFRGNLGDTKRGSSRFGFAFNHGVFESRISAPRPSG